MITDTEIKVKGISALRQSLGDVLAERFISLILKEPFDYTKWQRELFNDSDVKTISQKATEARIEAEKISK